MMEKIYLSRRNLLTLLSKLDRRATGEKDTYCMLLKSDDQHKTYAQTIPHVLVEAVEDYDYYTDREPGEVHPLDTPRTDKELWDVASQYAGREELHHSDTTGALVFRTPQEFAECFRSVLQCMRHTK